MIKREKYLLTIDRERNILFDDYLRAKICQGRLERHKVDFSIIKIIEKKSWFIYNFIL